MNIIIPNLRIPILHDIAQCLESVATIAGTSTLLWDTQNKSLIDMFDEYHPNIVFLHEEQLNSAFAVACQEFDFKYVLISQNPYEDLPKEASAILTLKPFLHHFKNHSAVMEVENYARIAQLHGAKYQDHMRSEVLVHSVGYTPTDEIWEVLYFLTSSHNTKIIGDTAVSLHNYLGKVNIFERANFIKSTQIVVDIQGHDFWDASYLKAAPVCMHTQHSHSLQFTNVESLKTHIDLLLSNDKERQTYTEKCYKYTSDSNTYYHFTAQLFNLIKEADVADHLLNFVFQIFNTPEESAA